MELWVPQLQRRGWRVNRKKMWHGGVVYCLRNLFEKMQRCCKRQEPTEGCAWETESTWKHEKRELLGRSRREG